MKAGNIILIIVFCTFIVSCSNKHKRFQPKATDDNAIAIIGSSDGSTNIVIEENNKTDKDTVILESPNFNLWYTKELPDKYKIKDFRCGQKVKYIGKMWQLSMCL